MLKHCLIAIELFANVNRVTVLGIFGTGEGCGYAAQGFVGVVLEFWYSGRAPRIST
jgi:hypothetical protein